MAKILVVDDNRENLILIERILRSAGHDVVTAANGRNALKLARADRPDAVITDILMPVMDGFELCRRWKADKRLFSLPFIFYSGTLTDSQDIQFALSLGADRFIAKPLEAEAFLREVRETLATSGEKPPLRSARKNKTDVMRGYSEILFRKLERKVSELEAEVENRRRAEAEIELKNAILSAQLETTIDAVLAVDENGNILFSNKRFVELWEIPYEAADSDSAEAAPGSFDGRLTDPLRSSESGAHLFERRGEKTRDEIVLADGRIIDRSSAPMTGEGGIYYGRIWYYRDVTEKRKSEKNLSLQAELLDSAIDSIFLLNMDGGIVYANRNAAELRGYSREEILGLNIRDLNDPENARQIPGRLETILRDGFALYESVHVKKNGARFHVEVLARVIEIDGKRRILTSNRDVTRRRHSLEALAESENRYRTLFEVSPDVMYSVAGDGTIAALNPAFEELTGWSRDEWIGRSVADLIHPDDREKNIELFRQILAGETMYAAEMRVLSKSGEYLVGEFSSAPFFHDGRIVGSHGVARDITDRKRAEKALRESEEKFHSIFDNAGEGIFLIDVETMRFVMCNPACTAMTGYTEEEFSSLRLNDMHSEEDLPSVKDGIAAFLKGERRFHNNLKFRRKDGSDFYADLSVAQATIAGRKYFILIFSDISVRLEAEREILMYKEHLEDLVEERTEELRRANERLSAEINVRVRAEENLRKERTLLRTLIDVLPDRIYATDREGRFILANTTMLRVFGLVNFRDLLDKTVFDLFNKERAERIFGEEQAIITNGQPIIDIEKEILAGDGERRWLLVSKFPFQDHEGNIMGLVSIDRDITGLKRTEESLQRAKEQAEAANSAKSAFLASVSHEIRTPMNAILGFTQLMLRESDITPRQRERLDTINKSGEHLIALLNNVLEFSKIETGHASVNLTTFNLCALIDGVETMFRLRAEEKRLRFTVTRADGLARSVVSDEVKIKQILINLIGNAVKFTDEGGVTVRVRLERGDPPQAIFTAEVDDTGCGVAAEDAEKIFREFEQAEAGASAGGAGLGLALSRRLARLLGGDITIERKTGKGTLFRVCFPMLEGSRPDVERGITRGRVARLKPGQATRTILVVDDNPENRAFLTETLSSMGFAALEAKNGKEAIELFRERRPHLVFMDINMEGMNGYEATARIRDAGGTSTPVIAVTSNAFLEIKERIRKAGLDGVIVKPFRQGEIFDVLAVFLGVEYEYEDASAASSAGLPAEVQRGIARLPRDLAAELLDAARNLEMNRLLAAVDRAESAAPEAAAYMRAAARKYHYRLFEDLLGGSEESDG